MLGAMDSGKKGVCFSYTLDSKINPRQRRFEHQSSYAKIPIFWAYFFGKPFVDCYVQQKRRENCLSHRNVSFGHEPFTTSASCYLDEGQQSQNFELTRIVNAPYPSYAFKKSARRPWGDYILIHPHRVHIPWLVTLRHRCVSSRPQQS